MLAQNFKTPAELGISDAGFDALVKVLGMLERGEIKEREFNMGSLAIPDECGTPACIRGWAQIFAGCRAFMPTHEQPNELRKLFYLDAASNLDLCRRFRNQFDNTSPAQAAIALRSYLTTGEARWAEALAE